MVSTQSMVNEKIFYAEQTLDVLAKGDG